MSDIGLTFKPELMRAILDGRSQDAVAEGAVVGDARAARGLQR